MSVPASLRLLVTRPSSQAQSLLDGLRRVGFNAEALPLMGVQPLVDPSSVREAWQHLAQFDWVFFVSPNAVQQFFAVQPRACRTWGGECENQPQRSQFLPDLQAHSPGMGQKAVEKRSAAVDFQPMTSKSERLPEWPLQWSPALQVGALGPGTAQALGEAGVPSSQVTAPPPQAEQVDSEALWARLAHRDWSGRRVMIVRGDGGRDWLANQLRAVGAEVQFVQAYRRTLPGWNVDQQSLLVQALADPVDHLWLFSSSQSIDHLLQLCPRGEAVWPRSRALATHPRIADRARAAGFGGVLKSAPDLQAIVACIQSASW